jgi:nitroreductase
MKITEAVASRRSVRKFLPDAVQLDLLRDILRQAQMAPSGCNYQPWEAVVLTGAPLHDLQTTLLAAQPDDPLEYDFAAPGQYEKYKSRLATIGAAMYSALRIGREDQDQRALFTEQNLTSFGAPVLLLCHFPKFMKEAQWSDVGMWLQTIMLLLREYGLDSCPQEWMGVYGRTIKTALDLSQDDVMLFCGLAIGYRDDGHPVNNFARDRVALDNVVKFIGFT